MPFAKRYRKKARRVRRVVRRRGGYRKSRRVSGTGRSKASVTLVRGPNQVFKDRMRTKITYTEILVLTPGSLSGYFAYTYRGNGPFDPNATGTGTQPYGYDQLSSIYDYYRVSASKIAAYPLSFETGTTIAGPAGTFQIVLTPNLNQTDLISNGINVNDLTQQRLAKSRWVNINTVDPRRSAISAYATTAKVLAESRLNARVDDTNEAFVTGLPSTQWYWQIYSFNPINSASGTLTIQVKVTYYVEFFGLKQYGSS